LIKEEKFDLVLLDIAMPEFTGMDVMASLKQDGRVRRKNIIVFTASSKETVDILLEQGAKEVLWKPCNLDEIKLLIVMPVTPTLPISCPAVTLSPTFTLLLPTARWSYLVYSSC